MGAGGGLFCNGGVSKEEVGEEGQGPRLKLPHLLSSSRKLRWCYHVPCESLYKKVLAERQCLQHQGHLDCPGAWSLHCVPVR